MLNIRLIIAINCLISLVLFFGCYSYAEETSTIKVALLDSFYNEMPLIPQTAEYEKAYFAGVETAAYEAKKYGLRLKYKPFIYGTGPLDIIGEIPKVQTWKPDVVLGPSSSDQCLLLKNYLPNIMTLSSYASDVNLKNISKHFYSTFLSDDRIMELLGDYIKKQFPNKNIYIIEQIDCKQCKDVGQLFMTYYKNISPKTSVVENKLVMDNINNINAHKLMAGHEGDVILVFNSTYYAYNIFVRHIASSIPNKKFIFFSDQDNWSNEVDGRTHKFDLSYESYRIGPILFDTASPSFKKFVRTFYLVYHKKPRDAISYMTYYSLMSVVKALHTFPDPDKSKSMREKILYSYSKALEKYPNWFRWQGFGIYRLTSTGEVLVKRLPTPPQPYGF